MVPDINLQLRVVGKALREVVAPALDQNNRVALEQLHLSIATLGFVESHLPLVRKYVRQELKNALALGVAVAAVATTATASLNAQLNAARTALTDADIDTGDLETLKSGLLARVSEVVNKSPDAKADRILARAVVGASKSQFDLARAWCLPAGFEPDPNEVPPLEEIISS